MVSSKKRVVWSESLGKMKTSLESSYEFKTIVEEEKQLLEGLKDGTRDYVVFSSYRKNAGKRRFNDIKSVIDAALEKLEYCDSDEASRIYLETLRTVSMQTRWASILETLSEFNPS